MGVSRRTFLETVGVSAAGLSAYFNHILEEKRVGNGDEIEGEQSGANLLKKTIVAASVTELKREYSNPADYWGALTANDGIYVSFDGEWIPANQNPSFESINSDAVFSPSNYATVTVYKRGDTVYAAGEDALVDSGSDAVTVLQSAINALPSLGGRIYVKTGTYKLSSGLTFPMDKAVWFEGESGINEGYFDDFKGTTFTVTRGFSEDIFTLGDGSSFVFGGMRNFTIDAANQSSGCGILARATQEFPFRHIEIKNCASDGLVLKNNGVIDCDVTLVDHCRVEACGGYGVVLDGGPYCWVARSEFDGSSAGGVLVSFEKCYVLGSYFTSEPRAISVGDDEITIANNKVYLSEYEGIRADTDHNIITGNTCVGNGQSGTDSYGIRLHGGSRNVVTGNVCTDTQDTKTQAYGIYTEAESDYNVLAPNVLRGNVKGGLSKVGPNSTTDGSNVV